MTIGKREYINNYSDTLDGSITSGATTIDVVDASLITTALTTGDYVSLTIDDGTNIEIVHCTATSTNQLTVTRGTEGTSGTAFATAVTIEARVTADSFNRPLWEVVEIQTLGSPASQIDFENLAGTYRVTLDSVSFDTNDTYLVLRVGTGATPTYDTGNNYRYSKGQQTSGSTTQTNTSGNSISYFQMFDLVYGGASTNDALSGTIRFNKLDDTGIYKSATWQLVQNDFDGSTHICRSSDGSGTYPFTTAVTAIRVYAFAGNFKAGSRIILERMRDD